MTFQISLVLFYLEENIREMLIDDLKFKHNCIGWWRKPL